MAIDFDAMAPEQAKQARLLLALTSLNQQAERPKRKQQGHGESKLELEFFGHLDMHGLKYWVKPFVLRIGPDMTFEPDVMVFEPACSSTYVIDVKGPHSWEDSRIKIKIAAEKYPLWHWGIVTRDQDVVRRWRYREVTAAKGVWRRFSDLPWVR